MLSKKLARRLLASSAKRSVDLRPEAGFPKLSQSYCHNAGEGGSTLTSSTFDVCLRETAEKYPDTDALIFHTEGSKQTFSEVYELSSKLADGLLQLGLERGDAVAMWGPSIKEWPLVQYALAQAGLVIVTINPLYTTAEVEYACEKADVKAIIAPPSMLDLHPYLERINAMKSPPKLKIMINNNMVMNAGKKIEKTATGTIDFDELVSSGVVGSSRLAAVNNDMDDLTMIQFTSGTTGQPKAAGLTHHNIVNNAIHIAQRADLAHGCKVLVNVPLFHCFGNVGGTGACAVMGFTGIFPHPGWNATASINAIDAHGATNMYGTPTMFVDMFTTVDANPELKEKMKPLKFGHVGASLMPAEYVQRANDQFNIQTQVLYGTTENSPYVTGCYLNDPFDKQSTTIGRPGDHMECKVVDDNGEIVPIGQPGELCTRGYQVFMGYLGDDAKTRKAIDPARWYHTGDTATMDDEGYLTIVGRSKDMIIRGGENVYPSEIEACLLENQNVIDAQVVGAADSRLGEVVAVYLKLKKDDGEASISELQQHCESRLAKYKIPKHWKVVDAYPQTLSGKVKKFELRDRTKDDFELRL